MGFPILIRCHLYIESGPRNTAQELYCVLCACFVVFCCGYVLNDCVHILQGHFSGIGGYTFSCTYHMTAPEHGKQS